MHRTVMNTKTGEWIDHIDRNKLNNTKNNLRKCTHAQNQQNRIHSNTHKYSSRYKGVWWRKDNQIWGVQINLDGKRLNIGSFKNEDNAGARYNDKALKYFGEFALLNYIPGHPVYGPIYLSQLNNRRYWNLPADLAPV